jgi:hypothetical protein
MSGSKLKLLEGSLGLILGAQPQDIADLNLQVAARTKELIDA